MENQATMGDSLQKVNVLIHRTADEALVLEECNPAQWAALHNIRSERCGSGMVYTLHLAHTHACNTQTD